MRWIFLLLNIFMLAACTAHTDSYRDTNMDFGAIQAVAVMPFANLSRDQMASERVRDVFMPMLLATGGVYVIPPGEVARGITRAGIVNPAAPSIEDVLKLAGIIKANAVITGTVREYGEIRSGTTAANVISVSLQMIETQTGKVVWAASTTKGGIRMKDRLLGGGGEPMNDITEKAVNELLDKLFK
ncbi:MAG: DUF799 family lipoprotein [Alphaproteobacteria bacterium]|uniref:DUF799 family lipoprotein n=1 Tax=Candidatus Nitrobium versatile TaxID=2884831 RepID=A0A953J9Q0_9BACT|nr:DUF799 family lipoprotein [Candidatus Nitrobium versatile]